MVTASMLELAPGEPAQRIPDVLEHLLTGPGAVVVRGLVPSDEIDTARQILVAHSSAEPDKVTHFQGEAEGEGTVHLQRRVWNLLNKGEVFERMVQLPDVFAIASAFLGSAVQLGSIAANRLLPGGPGQEPHIDYPYWDLHDADSFPVGINSSYPLNLQATILIDDFTEENGATAWLPGSQVDLRYPDSDVDVAAFRSDAERMTGEAGDVVVFNGMCWHCAMPNESNADRTGVLIEYLPKFVRPLEDHSVVRADVVDRATPELRQLLAIDHPYPQVLDDADAGNAEGSYRG